MVVLRTIHEQIENIFMCRKNVLILFYLKIKMGDKKMIYFFLIVSILLIGLTIYIIKQNNNYINEYNKRYIEKIKQNVARSLVTPYRKK